MAWRGVAWRGVDGVVAGKPYPESSVMTSFLSPLGETLM